jgi:sugar phosphate isomerase/epimerase
MKNARLTHIEWGSDVHAPCENVEQLKEINKLQNEYGIICSSYGTYFRLGVTPISELKKYIDGAKILGTKIIRVWCGSKSGAVMSSEEKSELLNQCSQAEKVARENDVVLCTECHKNTFTERLEDSILLMKSIGSPYFKTYWQPLEIKSEEENLSMAKAMAKYTEHIHVFNWKDKEKLPLELATSEWQAYLGAFTTPKTLLLEFMPDDKIETLKTEANALRKIIRR